VYDTHLSKEDEMQSLSKIMNQQGKINAVKEALNVLSGIISGVRERDFSHLIKIKSNPVFAATNNFVHVLDTMSTYVNEVIALDSSNLKNFKVLLREYEAKLKRRLVEVRNKNWEQSKNLLPEVWALFDSKVALPKIREKFSLSHSRLDLLRSLWKLDRAGGEIPQKYKNLRSNEGLEEIYALEWKLENVYYLLEKSEVSLPIIPHRLREDREFDEPLNAYELYLSEVEAKTSLPFQRQQVNELLQALKTELEEKLLQAQEEDSLVVLEKCKPFFELFEDGLTIRDVMLRMKVGKSEATEMRNFWKSWRTQ
jgi:hypothetical protein